MFKLNNIFFGIALSVILTITSFFLFDLLNKSISSLFIDRPFFRESFIMIMALATNMLPIRFFTKAKAFETARGIMISVFLVTAYYIYEYIF